MSDVRPATTADTEAIIATILAAFDGDPAWGFMIGDNAPAREAFARTLLAPRLRNGTVWLANEAASVALWDRRTLDEAQDPDRDELWRRFRAETGEEVWDQVEAYEEALEPLAPERPYRYLGILATRPSSQGCGLATSVLAPGFAAAAADGLDCWLETSKPENKAFYERRGFTESRPIDAPPVPRTWWLRRPHAE